MAKDSIDIVLSLKDNASNALKGFIRNLDLAKKKIEEVSRAAEKANLNIKANIQTQTSAAKAQPTTSRVTPVAVQPAQSSGLGSAALAAGTGVRSAASLGAAGIAKITGPIGSLGTSLEGVGTSLESLVGLVKVLSNALVQTGESTQFIATAIGLVNERMKETNTLTSAWAEAAEDIDDFYDDALQSLDKVTGKVRELTTLQQSGNAGGAGGLLAAGSKKLDSDLPKADSKISALRKKLNAPLSFGGLGFLGPLIGGFTILNTFQVGAKFEQLRASLVSVTGDAEKAKAVFAGLEELNKQLPTTLDETVTAFTRLSSLGIAPTSERLIAFSDMASAMGKSVLQFAEAVADASVGEFERLKEFGIKASKEGEKITFLFKGMPIVVKDAQGKVSSSVDDIVNTLTKIAQTNFAGASAKQMETLGGQVSNLQDKFQALQDKIMRGFGGDIARVVIDALSTIIDWMNKIFIEAGKMGIGLAGIIGRIVIEGGNAASLIYDLFSAAFKNIGIAATNLANTIRNGFYNAISGIAEFLGESYAKPADLPTEEYRSLSAAVDDYNKKREAELEIHNKAMQSWASEYDQRQRNKDATKSGADALQQMDKIVIKADEDQKKHNASLNQGSKELTGYAKFWKELIDSLKEHTNQLEWAKRAQEELNRAKQQGKITEAEYQMGLEKTNEILRNGLTGADKYYADLIKTEKDHTKQVEYAWEAQTKLDEAFQNGEISSAEYQRAIEKTKDDIGVLRDETEKSADAMNEFMLEAARSMQNAFSDFFFDIMQGKFDDLAGSFKRTLDRMVADFLASQLATFLFGNYGKTGSIGGVLGGLFSGGSSLFSGLFKAEGGPTKAGTPYIVGERGPELFVPRVSGNIIPNGAISSTGGTNNVSISITAMDSQSVLQALGKVKREAATMFNVTNRTYNLGVT